MGPELVTRESHGSAPPVPEEGRRREGGPGEGVVGGEEVDPEVRPLEENLKGVVTQEPQEQVGPEQELQEPSQPFRVPPLRE